LQALGHWSIEVSRTSITLVMLVRPFAKASSPSHKRYSRAKLAVLLRHANLDIRATHASFLQLSKIARSGQQVPIGTSPLPAERDFGLEPKTRNSVTDNKKPGVERRANPSFSSGATFARLPDGCARSSISFYPVFVTNVTSGSVGRPGPSADFPANQGSTNITQVYRNFDQRQVNPNSFFGLLGAKAVDFTATCGNRAARGQIASC
jgi:hypothetical protein